MRHGTSAFVAQQSSVPPVSHSAIHFLFPGSISDLTMRNLHGIARGIAEYETPVRLFFFVGQLQCARDKLLPVPVTNGLLL